MLSIHTSDAVRSGTRTRRQFLTAGGLALGGLSLSSLFAADGSTRLDTGKSVIFLFQQGGPSQFETFDPKPNAPAEIRTVGDLQRTPIPGVQFGQELPKLASVAGKFTVVRSFATENAAHNIVPIVSPASLDANLGCLFTRVAGAVHPNGVPRNAILLPQAVSKDVATGQGRGDLAATGSLGGSLAPFVPGGNGPLQKSLRLMLPEDRFTDRRALLAGFDDLRREAEPEFDQLDAARKQALEVLLSGSVADALDLTKEDPKTLAAYDTAPFVAKHNWERAQRGKRGFYTGHTKTIGKALLLARRLCEAGCGFVTIHTGYEGVWDMHADGNNLNMADGMEAVGRAFDHAVAAFIADVEARGLTDKILLVACGEMGRTPRLNKNGGRDHWAKLAPLMLYGGGTLKGKVVGGSTRDGGEPAFDACATPNLISTILHTMFDVGQLRLKSEFGPVAKLAEAKQLPLG